MLRKVLILHGTTGFCRVLCFSSTVWLACFGFFSPAKGQHQEVIQGGEIEYHQHCAVCHGPTGAGDGPMVHELAIKPADLRQLAKKDGGVFPFWRIYRVIDGRDLVRGHGSREMPVWGRRFKAQKEQSGPLDESLIKGRILGLVFYLQSIQR